MHLSNSDFTHVSYPSIVTERSMESKRPPPQQQQLKAYYKTLLGQIFLLVSVLGLGASLWMASKEIALPLSVLCVLLFGFGCYCLRRPYFLLEPRQLTVYNMFGLVTKRYTFESWDVVKADNRRIYIDNNGITIKVAVTPWLVETDDWLTMRKML